MKLRTRVLAVSAALLIPGAALSACAGTADNSTAADSGGAVTLSLVAYSTPQKAYEALIAAYNKTDAGKNIKFTQSYGASGDQSRAVANGLKADIVAFSLEPDITRLVTAKLVDASWNSDQYKGMITDSVAVIGTRKGNPKNIKTWDDLTKPGVQVLTPNPFTSGGAKWNILAAYGAKTNKGKEPAAGATYLDALFKNVPVQDNSGRASLQTFTSGKGDAFISYENEALFAQNNGQAVDYTVPDDTILIENPIAVTTNSAHPAEAKAFVEWLHSKDAQKIWADNFYRPVVKDAGGNFPTPSGLFTIGDLGGWSKVNKELFDPGQSVMASIEQKLGISTSAAPSPAASKS
ncbi:sulfate ABC transporter substrate-binding protein [Dactylosporangium matsuzakiense]|uniref:Sulfate ABC transporter, sulfate-binding protein SubI n=1 Tax=Dactylosporangium matsuzakiense TaxID=53360 RepID=A0A9W6KHS6_9ACTN|nr:sulfate ABC transporter substrate-binding protein [Dactylosporangium matsuzakiense]UWZ48225.1 sulfate ABC transporter substrate-binding protein [Dactylosporangium matsuzakiense]GLL01458.1 putative sulfate ABC transporter, sulfate-binding protein SubI [Dactylosporangium matsuzakiense]